MTPIKLLNLRKEFGTTVAVEDVSIEIAAGDLFFLLGPSGCGKTTILRMIAGFTEPTAGNIRFADKDVTFLPPNKRNTGMVFQSYALWPHMSVAQNVGFGLNVRKVKGEEHRRRVDEALRLVQMDKYADRKPNQLSGGQQQRVALARALVVEPTVLLLDEPLSNLDAKLRLEMRSQIRELCKKVGITGVYVTHDQKEALSMADHIAVLRDGKVMQLGAPRALYHRPANRFVADFLGETNFISGEVVGREEKNLIIECEAGRIQSSTYGDGASVKGNVTCSIRPEAIRFVNGSSPAMTNRLEAKRISQEYLGEMAQHKLVVGQQLPVKVFELNPRKQGEDEQCAITFDPEDVVVLQD